MSNGGLTNPSQDDIVAAIPRMRLPDIFFSEDESRSVKEALDELDELRQVLAASEQSTYWNRSEAAWNLLVHRPMLKLALSGLDSVGVELV